MDLETRYIHTIHTKTRLTLVIKAILPTNTLVYIIDSLVDAGYGEIKPIDEKTFNNFIQHYQALRCKIYMVDTSNLELFEIFVKGGAVA